jgi:hypothetical protein
MDTGVRTSPDPAAFRTYNWTKFSRFSALPHGFEPLLLHYHRIEKAPGSDTARLGGARNAMRRGLRVDAATSDYEPFPRRSREHVADVWATRREPHGRSWAMRRVDASVATALVLE